jgi:hypothetical protein
MTTISIDENTSGMAIRGKTIYYCTENKGVRMLNKGNYKITELRTILQRESPNS